MIRGCLFALILVSSAALTTACVIVEDDDDAAGDLSAPDEICLSGTAWVGGNTESAHMHPGRDCLGCHQDLGEAAEVVLGGTVYGGPNQRDDCFGVPGVVMELTDANGEVISVTSNAAGNFVLTETSIATPYSVKLEYEGRVRVMAEMQTELSCNSCHTNTGANGAPGRILVP